MSMSDRELDLIVDNEKEWRITLYREITNTRKELHEFKISMTEITTTLKVKIGIAGAFFGFIGGSIISVIVALVK